MVRTLRLFIIVLLALLAACNPYGYPDFMKADTPTPAALVAAPATATPVPLAPTPAPTLQPTSAAPTEQLNPTGPWLTFLADSASGYELFAANPDGSTVSMLGALPNLSSPMLTRPTGAGTAFSLYNPRTATLTIFRLPDGATLASFSLLTAPDLTNDQKRLYGDILSEQITPAQAWSPDGNLLAFTGAMDGAFTDVYIYDTRDGSLRRLTGNLGESSFPTWSPDSSALLVQELLMYPALASHTTLTVYYLSLDGVTQRTLYKPESAYEQIFGWTDNDTFVVASQRPAGLQEARRYLLNERRHAQLKYASAMEIAAFSPEKTVVAFIAQPKDKNAGGLAAGLYWTSPNSGPVSVERGAWQRLQYRPAAGLFFAARSGAVVSFYPGVDPITYADEENLPAVSSDGAQLAFWAAAGSASPGLRLYSPDGLPGRAITTKPVTEAMWSPDGQTLFFISQSDLYRVSLPDGEPETLAKGVSHLGWVGAP